MGGGEGRGGWGRLNKKNLSRHSSFHLNSQFFKLLFLNHFNMRRTHWILFSIYLPGLLTPTPFEPLLLPLRDPAPSNLIRLLSTHFISSERNPRNIRFWQTLKFLLKEWKKFRVCGRGIEDKWKVRYAGSLLPKHSSSFSTLREYKLRDYT